MLASVILQGDVSRNCKQDLRWKHLRLQFHPQHFSFFVFKLLFLLLLLLFYTVLSVNGLLAVDSAHK
jgi:hypothetical protein